mmetsp:Transcript_48690/g.54463  ORF Transcript_48690/g.54463 Transcript_48690/m.54463 type:complete len:344 (-) Transcript_48690:220-1251(-)
MRSTMSKSFVSPVLKLVFAGNATVTVSSYTFDPMNNSWKPSGVQHRRHHTSSSASAYSYAPAEPAPSAGVEFTYKEDDIVRHHYAGMGGQGEIDSHYPAFVRKESLVQIEYNKKTGEVSLHDQDGIVTKEEYERLMKAVKSSGDEERINSSEQRQQGVAVGTTHLFDTEELDLNDIIDTQGEELPSQEEEQHQYQHPVYQQQNEVDSQSQQYHHLESVSFDSFDTYSISQPAMEINHPVQQQPMAAQAQYYHQSQPVVAQVVAESIEPTQYYYQTQTPIVEPVPSSTQHQHYHQLHSQSVASSSTTSAAPSATADVVEKDAEESSYRSSRGFGFANRRQYFGI